MNQSTCNPSPACNPTHSTPHAIRSNVVPATPHTVVHNGEVCVAIPLSEFKGIFDDVDCINDALGDYNNIVALLTTNHNLKAWTVQSLHSVMHLNLDIHTDIMSNIAYRLKHYLPKDQLQAYEQAREQKFARYAQ